MLKTCLSRFGGKSLMGL